MLISPLLVVVLGIIIIINLRELGPATANPGDAHVNVGSERESASSDNLARFGWDEIDGFLSLFSPRGPSQICPLLRISLPKRTPSTDGIRRPRSGFIHRSFHNPTQSGAQLFIAIAPRSGFSHHSNFASGLPKPSRNLLLPYFYTPALKIDTF